DYLEPFRSGFDELTRRCQCAGRLRGGGSDLRADRRRYGIESASSKRQSVAVAHNKLSPTFTPRSRARRQVFDIPRNVLPAPNLLRFLCRNFAAGEGGDMEKIRAGGRVASISKSMGAAVVAMTFATT